ncbi:hypothetical protein [Streptomyces achromogenes]|uniref:hypothetical protein n=1 Tax=Streptomyces achromogenes TaxID=67255 RepID=UPI0036FE12DD
MAIQYFWRHPLAEQVREEGRRQGLEESRKRVHIEGWQEMVPRILEWRGIAVPDVIRERVMACEDLDRLEGWAQRAVRATDAAELFAGE